MTPLGTLALISVPIGNSGDITLRALETLKQADLLFVEDKRVTSALLAHYHIETPQHRFDTRRLAESLALLRTSLESGKSVALVSDAGTPAVADPGNRAVQEALKLGAKVIAVPGASALLTALLSSGMATGRFAFDGFPPTFPTDRHHFFSTLENETRTIILYEIPRRLRSTLCTLERHLGTDRNVMIAKDLTKPTEQLTYTTLGEACQNAESGVRKGEYTLVISKKNR